MPDAVDAMSNAAVPLSSLLGPTLSLESSEAILREKAAALESEIDDWRATIIMRDNIIQLAYEEIHRLTEISGLESSFRDWMLSWPRKGEEEKNA